MKHNPTEPVVKLELDGEEFDLLFELEAISAAEDVTGLALITGLREKDVQAPRISMIRALLWACLQPKQPSITRQAASVMVTQFNCHKIWDKVLEAWVTGMRKPKEGADPTQGQS